MERQFARILSRTRQLLRACAQHFPLIRRHKGKEFGGHHRNNAKNMAHILHGQGGDLHMPVRQAHQKPFLLKRLQRFPNRHT